MSIVPGQLVNRDKDTFSLSKNILSSHKSFKGCSLFYSFVPPEAMSLRPLSGIHIDFTAPHLFRALHGLPVQPPCALAGRLHPIPALAQRIFRFVFARLGAGHKLFPSVFVHIFHL